MKKTGFKIKPFLVFFLLLSNTVWASINTIQQYGLNAGDLPDPESDTLLINPAYGYTQEKPRISMNFFYGADEVYEFEPLYVLSGLQNSGFLDLNYLQPLSRIFGFYINATPIMQDYEILYHSDYGYGSLDVGGGLWLQVIPGLTIGISGKYFSGKLGDQPGFYTKNERSLDTFFLRTGFSIDLSSRWNIGYALRYMPNEGAISMASTLHNLRFDTYLYRFFQDRNPDFSHDFFVRSEISNSASLANHIDMRLDNIFQYLSTSSILKIKINTTSLLAGLKYSYYNTMAGASMIFNPVLYHDFFIFSGAEFLVVPWLKLRLGVSLFSLVFDNSEDPYMFINFFPQFQGGLNFRISPAMDFEINLSKTMIFPLVTSQAFLFNFELSYNFK